MTVTATTLSGAIDSTQILLTVASASNISAPNFQTASGITVLIIEEEQLLVMGVNGTQISVLRGQNGTQSASHASGALVQVGVPSDFTLQQMAYGNFLVKLSQVAAFKRPAVWLIGTADAIDATVSGHYVVKTGSADAMTLATPAAAAEGNIIEVWSDTDFAHTLTAASALFCVGANAQKTVCTFPAFRGAGVILRVCNSVYHLIGSSGTGTNSGPVVWT